MEEDVSQGGSNQAEALEENLRTLSSLQAALLDVEKKSERAEQDLGAKNRKILTVEHDIELMDVQAKALYDSCASIVKENTELQMCISEKENDARVALERFNSYREKMEGHRAAVLHVVRQTEAHKELEAKKRLVWMLVKEKEGLMGDFENLKGGMRERDALKEESFVRKAAIAERRQQLEEEFKIHSQIKKDIEIQNKRYKAIIKRLHCQLRRTQTVLRQMSANIHRMKLHLAELKRQQESDTGH
ncbi:coiled-coil domain-containing protein 122 [Parambassis ranga]|uniref:Coiled-coil domain-containing protein 122 n=1 Tax=Parambassis ranga TaxID=210632 RepID=A0A6P7JFA6_9TELE|nr:coiled-coil domain-containing protein 122 [Parambassis ranga]